MSSNELFPVNTSIQIEKTNRLGYDYPENKGLDNAKFKTIDSIVNYAINEKMTPGVQLVVAKGGDIVYKKNYGYQTYAKKAKVTDSTLYDVASLTKIISTLPLVMEMEEKGIMSLNSKLGELLPELADSNKKNITIKQMLSHYARLKAWIPFYKATLDSLQKPSLEFYAQKKSDSFPFKVAENLFIKKSYQDSIFKRIKDTDLA